jgi:hypothetical protein
LIDVESVFELLHLARRSYRTVEARVVRQMDGDVLAEDQRRRGWPVPSSAGRSEAVDHLWFASPSDWLVEAQSGPGAGLIVGQRDERSIRNFRIEDVGRESIERAVYLGGPSVFREVMWEPNLLIPETWLEPHREERIARRKVIAVHGLPRPTSNDFLTVRPADEYDLAVDLERGVLLRYGLRYAGRVGVLEEVLDIEFDRALSETVFDLS